jgi:endonuclease YncB( thermonuclease family)
MLQRVLWFLVLGAAAGLAHAREFDASVTFVTDGDTLWVRAAPGRKAQQLRLQGIDAPEICQPGGAQSREALQRRLLDQRVRVRASGRDSYGRIVAQVHLKGQDAGEWMVRQGHAWSYRSGRQRPPYAEQERAAREGRLGLWREAQPMQPRVFRRFHGPCEAP